MKTSTGKISKALARVLIGSAALVRDRWASDLLIADLRKRGARMDGRPRYISYRSYFDGLDYSLLEFGEGCTVSFYCRFLTHDWSPDTVARGLGHNVDPPLGRIGPIRVGRFAFVGAGSILLPGTTIGDHAIVGAGSVVRGEVPPYAIVTGNPAQLVGDSRDLVERHMRMRAAAAAECG